MKKFIAVPIIGILAAMSFAFAANLDVSRDVATLQVGTTQVGDMECATSAKVVAWGYNDNQWPSTVTHAYVDVTQKSAGSCANDTLYLQAFNSAEVRIGAHNYTAPVPSNTDTVVRVEVKMPETPGPAVGARELRGARIAIDQGPTLPIIP